MNKAQLSQQSLHPHSYITNQSSISIQPNIKKSTQRDHSNNSKQNESKHMNAIRPYVSSIKQRERKISKRDSQKSIPIGSSNNSAISNLYPYESNSKNKNKKEMSMKKSQQPTTRNITDLYTQLISIKTEYRNLKNCYNDLVKQKNDLTERGEKQAANIITLTAELDKARKQEQKSRNNLKFLEQEIQRIKKQCVRLVETEKFKNKKLEETIQEKQLMIAYLRSQLSVLNGDPSTNNTGFFFQHTAPTYVKNPAAINDLNYKVKQVTLEPSVVQLIKNNNSSSKIREQNPQIIYNNIDRSIINHSMISSIPNTSILANSELVVDLPRQLGSKKKPTINIAHVEPQQEKYAVFGHQISVNEDHNHKNNKRQYIFSAEDDSLSFSYQKSKEDIREYDSVQSSDPTILTFTKKDVYVLDQQQQQSPNSKYTGSFLKNKEHVTPFQQQREKDNLLTHKHDKGQIRQARNRPLQKQQKIEHSESDYSDISDPHNNDDKSSCTGQQQIMTFENRYGKKQTHSDLIKLLNPLKQKKKISKSQNKIPEQIKLKNKNRGQAQYDKKQVSSKSKLLTKRLQINTDEIGLGECKESSAQTKKQLQQIKTGKKKINRKRKSEESGSLIKK